MKKIIILIALLFTIVFVNAQDTKKYIVYSDSLDAYTKIYQINKVASVLKWKDGISDNYCYLKWNKTHTLCAVPIEQGYENYFTEAEKKSAIILDNSWNVKY